MKLARLNMCLHICPKYIFKKIEEFKFKHPLSFMYICNHSNVNVAFIQLNSKGQNVPHKFFPLCHIIYMQNIVNFCICKYRREETEFFIKKSNFYVCLCIRIQVLTVLFLILITSIEYKMYYFIFCMEIWKELITDFNSN